MAPRRNKQCKCVVILEDIMMERQRLEENIWRRAFDHLHTFCVTKFNCVYSEFIARIFECVNRDLFHGLGSPVIPARSMRYDNVCKRPPMECEVTFKTRGVRLTLFFYSYAAACRMLFLQHQAQLKDVQKCCNLSLHSAQYPPVDFSSLVFRYINDLFFSGMLRARNINVPGAVVAQAKNRFYGASPSLYSTWLSLGGWERAAASCGVARPCVPFIEAPRVDPPPTTTKEDQPQQKTPEEVEVLFLD